MRIISTHAKDTVSVSITYFTGQTACDHQYADAEPYDVYHKVTVEAEHASANKNYTPIEEFDIRDNEEPIVSEFPIFYEGTVYRVRETRTLCLYARSSREKVNGTFQPGIRIGYRYKREFEPASGELYTGMNKRMQLGVAKHNTKNIDKDTVLAIVQGKSVKFVPQGF